MKKVFVHVVRGVFLTFGWAAAISQLSHPGWADQRSGQKPTENLTQNLIAPPKAPKSTISVFLTDQRRTSNKKNLAIMRTNQDWSMELRFDPSAREDEDGKFLQVIEHDGLGGNEAALCATSQKEYDEGFGRVHLNWSELWGRTGRLIRDGALGGGIMGGFIGLDRLATNVSNKETWIGQRARGLSEHLLPGIADMWVETVKPKAPAFGKLVLFSMVGGVIYEFWPDLVYAANNVTDRFVFQRADEVAWLGHHLRLAHRTFVVAESGLPQTAPAALTAGDQMEVQAAAMQALADGKIQVAQASPTEDAPTADAKLPASAPAVAPSPVAGPDAPDFIQFIQDDMGLPGDDAVLTVTRGVTRDHVRHWMQSFCHQYVQYYIH